MPYLMKKYKAETIKMLKKYSFNTIILLITVAWISCNNLVDKTSETPIEKDPAMAIANEKMLFWDSQQKGVNAFNQTPKEEWYEAAKQANIKLVRLTFGKWKGVKRDFLVGNADKYEGIPEPDFQQLKKFLDIADEKGIKVVPTPLSLPGFRYVQNNNKIRDGRLWKDFTYWEQAIQYWTDIAQLLKGHPAVVAYGIVNEPYPEYFYGSKEFWNIDFKAWYAEHKDTPADLNLFYKKIVAAIRKVDGETPIVLESGQYATPWAFEGLQVLEDPYLIYSFHMYEPYGFTTYRINKEKYHYPGMFPIQELGDQNFNLNYDGLKDFFQPIVKWQSKNNVPANRIWVGEFGCDRRTKGVARYLGDLVHIFNAQQWHWALYSYREDVWQAMDYELGTEKVYWKYWDWQAAKELNLHYDELYAKTADNPIWTIFKKEFEE